MKSYIKIVKAMFSGNKRVLAEAFSVMVILLALEMAIPVCVNKMINGLAVENRIVTFFGGIFLFACAYGKFSVQGVQTRLKRNDRFEISDRVVN